MPAAKGVEAEVPPKQDLPARLGRTGGVGTVSRGQQVEEIGTVRVARHAVWTGRGIAAYRKVGRAEIGIVDGAYTNDVGHTGGLSDGTRLCFVASSGKKDETDIMC